VGEEGTDEEHAEDEGEHRAEDGDAEGLVTHH
jgi:hypothetical protein